MQATRIRLTDVSAHLRAARALDGDIVLTCPLCASEQAVSPTGARVSPQYLLNWRGEHPAQGADVDRHLVASRNYLTHLERRHQVADAERRHLPIIAHDPRSADTSAHLLSTFVDRLVVSVVCVCVHVCV